MLKVNDTVVPIEHFPDGTLRLKLPDSLCPSDDEPVVIEWRFENNEEMAALMFLTRQIQDKGYVVELNLPYIPNARQDRCESEDDVFTLKYFAEFINNLCFACVRVLDAHSPVSTALIDRVLHYTPAFNIETVINNIAERENIDTSNIIPCFPDVGALKRYNSMTLDTAAPVYGNKTRDWETGKITGLQMLGNVEGVSGSVVLIVDDICSYGGTFYYSAQELKKLGASKIYLYVTHCENSILNGKLFPENMVEMVYTTSSIFTAESDKVEVIDDVFF